MKKILKVSIILLIVTFLVGCSGKVQTNPITKDNVYVFPKKKYYKNVISNEHIADFKSYANQKLRIEKFNVIEATKKIELNNNNENTLWNSGYKATK